VPGAPDLHGLANRPYFRQITANNRARNWFNQFTPVPPFVHTGYSRLLAELFEQGLLLRLVALQQRLGLVLP
jgi:hypothetical protein